MTLLYIILGLSFVAAIFMLLVMAAGVRRIVGKSHYHPGAPCT